jgi:hypothetical protein
MNVVSFPFLIVWIIGAMFSVTGFINIAGPRRLREAYARWEFPTRFYLVLGLIELAAAALLAMPEWRSWGIALAAFIIFGTVITLFNHRHYMSALPGVALMVALVPATFAVPHDTHPLHYLNAQSSD